MNNNNNKKTTQEKEKRSHTARLCLSLRRRLALVFSKLASSAARTACFTCSQAPASRCRASARPPRAETSASIRSSLSLSAQKEHSRRETITRPWMPKSGRDKRGYGLGAGLRAGRGGARARPHHPRGQWPTGGDRHTEGCRIKPGRERMSLKVGGGGAVLKRK